MAKRRLNEKNIDQLLAHYRNERRHLVYQLDLVKAAIEDLKQQKVSGGSGTDGKEATDGVKEVKVKRGPGRPKGSTNKVAGKPGRPKKRERKERELNEWDKMVIDTITERGLLLPKEDLLDAATTWAKVYKPQLSKPEVETFLTRTLQKLSGKKKLLGTHHSGLRRGYHYGLIDWFFQSSGKLRKQHYDRLVLKPATELEPAEA